VVTPTRQSGGDAGDIPTRGQRVACQFVNFQNASQSGTPSRSVDKTQFGKVSLGLFQAVD
jgi:hypothetical protein